MVREELLRRVPPVNHQLKNRNLWRLITILHQFLMVVAVVEMMVAMVGAMLAVEAVALMEAMVVVIDLQA